MSPSLMKFIASIAMFAVWVTFAAWGMTPVDPLITFCQLGLTGLASHLATAYIPSTKE